MSSSHDLIAFTQIAIDILGKVLGTALGALLSFLAARRLSPQPQQPALPAPPTTPTKPARKRRRARAYAPPGA